MAEYADEITEQERELGFEMAEIANPAGEFAFAPQTVSAVIIRIGPSDRIIKLNNPITKRPCYQHQCFGTYGSSGRKAWKPVQITFDNPEMAIATWKAGRDNIQGDPMNPHVTPCDPGDKY